MKLLKLMPLMLFAFVLSSFTIVSTVSKETGSTANTNIKAEEQSIQKITAFEFSKMSTKAYGQLRGKKLNFKERVVFRALKREMKNQVKIGNGEHDMSEFMSVALAEGERQFRFGGFIVGFLFGLIGVALVHIFSSDKDVRRSSWYGFGALLILVLVAALI